MKLRSSYPNCHHYIDLGGVVRAWPRRSHGPLVECDNGEKYFGDTLFEAVWKGNGWILKTPELIFVGDMHYYRIWVDEKGRALNRDGPVIECYNGDKFMRDELCGHDSPLEFILFLLMG